MNFLLLKGSKGFRMNLNFLNLPICAIDYTGSKGLFNFVIYANKPMKEADGIAKNK